MERHCFLRSIVLVFLRQHIPPQHRLKQLYV